MYTGIYASRNVVQELVSVLRLWTRKIKDFVSNLPNSRNINEGQASIDDCFYYLKETFIQYPCLKGLCSSNLCRFDLSVFEFLPERTWASWACCSGIIGGIFADIVFLTTNIEYFEDAGEVTIPGILESQSYQLNTFATKKHSKYIDLLNRRVYHRQRTEPNHWPMPWKVLANVLRVDKGVLRISSIIRGVPSGEVHSEQYPNKVLPAWCHKRRILPKVPLVVWALKFWFCNFPTNVSETTI